MNVTETALPGVLVFEPRVFGDHRGYFLETWRADVFTKAGITLPFVQDNQSSSRQGVLRGIHYQVKQPQGKLVRVISGRVFDVAVDLRRTRRTSVAGRAWSCRPTTIASSGCRPDSAMRFTC
jgi:dTDP-4-dehydrorhamnose 3,5-epimerase